MRHDNFIPNVTRRSRGRLPHWEVDDADYFVTFRLRDSLPIEITRRLLIERKHLAQTAHTEAERAEIDRQFGLVLFHLDRGEELHRILHSWKSYTAHRIGLGVIWQREYFDRVIRGPEEFRETRRYILVNPARAGLSNWPWVGGGTPPGQPAGGRRS